MNIQKEILFGVKYCQHRDFNESDWDIDFPKIKEAGLDALRIHAFWAAIEPTEGKYDFSVYDRLVKKAGEYGLSVLFTLYLVSAPEWVFEKHGDSRFVSARGSVWNSNQFPDNAHGGWPGLCFDSDSYRMSVKRFVQEFALHFKGWKEVLAIDVWHEPDEEPAQQYGQSDWRELLYCYCDHSVQKFRLWLKEKYKSLAQLNQVWTRHYENWNQVQPPREYGTFTEWLDWKHFRMERITNQVQWVADLIKECDPKRVTSVHCGIYEIRHPFCSSNNHFDLADATDYFACSLYDTRNPELSGFVCDLMRSASHNEPYWIGETETGSGPMFVFLGEAPEDYFAFSRPADPKEIQRLSWSVLARGAKGILYWGWRPDISTMETVSLGVMERDGTPTDRYDMLKGFTANVKKIGADLAACRSPKSSVAVLYNLDGIIQEGFVSLARSKSPIVSIKNQYYKDTLSLLGCYKLCMKLGIQVDFISEKEVLSGKLKEYETLMMPYSISLPLELADRIEQFIADGGNALSDGMCGFFTDGGWGSEVCPPHGLHRAFGVKVRSNYDLIELCDIQMNGSRFHNVGRFVKERLIVDEAATVAGVFDNGEPAVVANRYGRGRTVYVGSLFFAAAAVCDLGVAAESFRNLLSLLSVSSSVELQGVSAQGLLEVREQLSEQAHYVFIINHGAEKERARICVRAGRQEETIDCVCGEGKPENVVLKDGKLSFTLAVDAGEVSVLRVGQ